MLASIGVSEAEVRERSIPWVEERIAAARRDEASKVATQTRLTFVAVQAAQHGGDAYESFESVLAELDDSAHVATPTDDLDAVREMRQRGIGFHERIKVSRDD